MPENNINTIEAATKNVLLLNDNLTTKINTNNDMYATTLNFAGDTKYCDITPAIIVPMILIKGKTTNNKFFVFSFSDNLGKNVNNAIYIKV